MPNAEIVTHERFLKSFGVVADNCVKAYFADLGGKPPLNNLHAKVIRQTECALIRHTLTQTRWNIVKAAGLLGIDRNTLRAKMVMLGMDIKAMKAAKA